LAGSLTVFTGGMFAEKSTALIREGKRHLLAGRKVVFLKPKLDDRYSEDAVVTHDGIEYKAYNVSKIKINDEEAYQIDFDGLTSLKEADVVCIDEVQFFDSDFIEVIDGLIYEDKKVYVAGLDLDRFGKPFGIVPYLMARAETVKKFHAVCNYCGADAWVTLGTKKLNNNNQVNVSNDYVPACRTCAEKVGGIK
jgi:thymidine kinase